MVTGVLSHDIDRTRKTYQFFTKPAREFLKGNFRSGFRLFKTIFRKDNYWTFEEIIEIEKSFDIRSTFFFLNESMKLVPTRLSSYYLALGRYDIMERRITGMIRKLDSEGWEIGVHGSFESYKDINLLRKEKETLESIVGHEIHGIRQHHLNMTSETWKLQNVVGFLYDSSLGSNDRNGFPDDRIAPFHPLGNGFTVFPQVIMDKCFMESKNRWEELDSYIEICKAHNAVLVINFHNHSFNEIEFPGYRDTYIELINRCLERGVVFRKFHDLIQSTGT